MASNGLVTADFLFSIEKRSLIINERSFLERMTREDMWAADMLTARPIEGKSARLTWLLETASIEQLTPADGGENGGSLSFEQLATMTTEVFPAHHGRALKMGKLKFMNLMQAGLDPLGSWARQMGAYGAYVPQRETAKTLLNGENIVGYDGVNYFATNHPVHPLIPGLGTYANLFTGAVSGSYPGALPIDDSVTLDVALQNIVKGISYIEGAIAAPNGAGDPRMLHVEKILYPPQLSRRVSQLTEAEFISQQSAGGAGSADIRPIMKKFQLADSHRVAEFDGNRSYQVMGANGLTTTVTGSDTSYYMVCRELSTSELGGLMLNTRLPFGMQTYTGDGGNVDGVDAILGRSNDLEYHYQGWLAVNVGHPYLVFKFKST